MNRKLKALILIATLSMAFTAQFAIASPADDFMKSELHIYLGFEPGQQFVDDSGALCSVQVLSQVLLKTKHALKNNQTNDGI
jgi:hypothetical protein